MDANIKELLKGAKTEEEAMKILEAQRIELTDEELEELRGGTLWAVECGTVIISSVTISITVT